MSIFFLATRRLVLVLMVYFTQYLASLLFFLSMIPLNTLILTKHVVPQSGLVDLPDVAKGLPDLLGPIIGVLDVVAEVDYDKGFVLAWIITCL